MIIFGLDGTLADCEHRRHFVDVTKNPNYIHGIPPNKRTDGVMILRDYHKETGELWQPDWKAFYEACGEDKLIYPVFNIMISIDQPYEIWSGRCESVKEKTEKWLCQFMHPSEIPEIKMRPIGDSTPDEILKEKWLDEALAEGKKIDFVFDDRKKVCDMWVRRGIFVFDVSQGKGDF